MQILIHFKKQELEKHMTSLIQLNEAYIKKSHALNESLINTLKEVEAYFKQIGSSTNESKVSQLHLYFQTALNGIDPVQLQKVKTGRRALVATAAFYCLNEMHEILQKALQKVLDVLQNTEETLSQLMITALQNNLINDETIETSNNIEQIQQLWENLLSNDQIKMFDKKLRLEILAQDIYLLISTIFEKFKNDKS